jgi:prepilin-type N-terminal cleavage/methylation domain-containing protein
MKKAFTIIELLVAMALLAMLIAISGMVFSTAVKAQRAAGATMEITAKLQVITQQLNADLRGLQKTGEFLLVLDPIPVYTIKDGKFVDADHDGWADFNQNSEGLAERYIFFDRLMFFADGDFQSYDAQPTASVSGMVFGNTARICYSFGRDTQNTRAWDEPNPAKRMLCRTQHIIATTTVDGVALNPFPDLSGTWNAADFETKNFSYEYQTMTMENWLAIPVGNPMPIKDDMLSKILDLRVGDSVLPPPQGGPKVNVNDSQTLHQLFMQGIGQFHIQFWRSDLNRWYPEIDPNGDGLYNDADPEYLPNALDVKAANRTLGGRWIIGADEFNAWMGPALKFTFTLYDSNGVFKDGKTFTHIVYLQ